MTFLSKEEFDEIYCTNITQSEKKILEEFLNGKSDLQIAKARFVEESTVRKHLQNAAYKFGIIDPEKRTYYRTALMVLCSKYLKE